MTAPPFRFGYKASAEQFGPNELPISRSLAEEHGFDSVFISDHLQPWRHDGGHAPASLPWLGAVGARTSRVMLGTSVLTPTFRYHPAVIAQAFATLGVDVPGAGRARGGHRRGAQRGAPGHRLAGAARSGSPGSRRRSTLIRELWTGERVTFEGDVLPHRQRHDLRQAGRSGADLHRCLRSGGDPAGGPDRGRLHHHVGQGPALYTDTLLPALRDGLEKAGRAPDDVDTLMEMKVSLRPRPGAARRTPGSGRRSALTPEEKTGVDDPLEMQRLAEELPIERAASRFIVSDDPDEHVERIGAYIDLGFRHLVFHDPGHDQEHSCAGTARRSCRGCGSGSVTAEVGQDPEPTGAVGGKGKVGRGTGHQSAASRASRIGIILIWASRASVSGSESATIPHPASSRTLRPFTWAQRSAMANSPSPAAVDPADRRGVTAAAHRLQFGGSAAGRVRRAAADRRGRVQPGGQLQRRRGERRPGGR